MSTPRNQGIPKAPQHMTYSGRPPRYETDAEWRDGGPRLTAQSHGVSRVISPSASSTRSGEPIDFLKLLHQYDDEEEQEEDARITTKGGFVSRGGVGVRDSTSGSERGASTDRNNAAGAREATPILPQRQFRAPSSLTFSSATGVQSCAQEPVAGEREAPIRAYRRKSVGFAFDSDAQRYRERESAIQARQTPCSRVVQGVSPGRSRAAGDDEFNTGFGRTEIHGVVRFPDGEGARTAIEHDESQLPHHGCSEREAVGGRKERRKSMIPSLPGLLLKPFGGRKDAAPLSPSSTNAQGEESQSREGSVAGSRGSSVSLGRRDASFQEDLRLGSLSPKAFPRDETFDHRGFLTDLRTNPTEECSRRGPDVGLSHSRHRADMPGWGGTEEVLSPAWSAGVDEVVTQGDSSADPRTSSYCDVNYSNPEGRRDDGAESVYIRSGYGSALFQSASSGFSGNKEKLNTPIASASGQVIGSLRSCLGPYLGLENASGVFSFDPVLGVFCFATVEGDLQLVSIDSQVTLRNPYKGVHHWHLVFIPGTGRIVSCGEQQLDQTETETSVLSEDRGAMAAGPFCSSAETLLASSKKTPLAVGFILQVWNFASALKPHHSERETIKTTDAFSLSGTPVASFEDLIIPVSFVVPYRVYCLRRVLSSRTQDGAKLYAQCLKTIVAGRVSKSPERGERKTGATSAVGSPSSGSQKNGPTREERLAAARQFSAHPDNSTFPFGNPSGDSRWLLIVGTSEGDVRFFDAFQCQFLDYVITAENVCSQLNADYGATFHPLLKRLIPVEPLANLPGVHIADFDPVDSRVLLIGYANGLAVLWNVSTHRVLRWYPPLPQSLIASGSYASQGDRGSYDKRRNSKSWIEPPAAAGNAPSVIVLPSDFPPLAGPLFLNAAAWNPHGGGFVLALSSLNSRDGSMYKQDRPKNDNRQESEGIPSSRWACTTAASLGSGKTLATACVSPFTVSFLAVYSLSHQEPRAVLSLNHILRSDFVGTHVSYLFWDAPPRQKTVAGGLPQKGNLYVLVSRLNSCVLSSVNSFVDYWDRFISIRRLGDSSSSFAGSIPSAPAFDAYGTRPTSCDVNSVNFWRLTGAFWLDAVPVFPPLVTVQPLDGKMKPLFSPFSGSGVVLIPPTPLSLREENPVACSLCDLVHPLDAEKDEGEDADLLVKAARKLGQYLVAGTLVLILSESPTRRVLGACLKIPHDTYQVMRYLHAQMISGSKVRPRGSGVYCTGLGALPARCDAAYRYDASPKSPQTNAASRSPISEQETEENDLDDALFAPWDKLKNPLCFEVNWQGLAMSGVTALTSVPRVDIISPSEAHTHEWDGPSHWSPVFRPTYVSANSYCGKKQRRGKQHTGTRGSLPGDEGQRSVGGYVGSSAAGVLDGFVDALYTLRKKHIVQGWLSGLSGRPDRIFIGVIPGPKNTEDTGGQGEVWKGDLTSVSTERCDERGRGSASCVHRLKRSSSSDSTVIGRSALSSVSSDETDEFEGDEWRVLNETPFFGDLLRVSESVWGNHAGCPCQYQGVVFTGHVDGKIRCWLYTPHGVTLLSVLRLINKKSVNSVLDAPEIKRRAASAGDSMAAFYAEDTDAQLIGALDAKPVVPCLPSIPAVTVLSVLIQSYYSPTAFNPVALDSLNGPDKHWSTSVSFKNGVDIQRRVAAGSASGDIVVFSWTCRARDRPATSKPKDKYKQEPYDNGITDVNGRSQLPFGFFCEVAIKCHTTRVTALLLVEFVCPGDESREDVGKALEQLCVGQRTPRRSVLMGITSRARRLPGLLGAVTKEQLLSGHRDVAETVEFGSESGDNCPDDAKISSPAHLRGSSRVKVISGDALGLVVVTDVEEAEVLVTHPPPASDLGFDHAFSSMRDLSSGEPFQRGGLGGSKSSSHSHQSVTGFHPLAVPLLGPLWQLSLGGKVSPPQSPGTGGELQPRTSLTAGDFGGLGAARYLLVTYASGLLRTLDLLSGRFLDEEVRGFAYYSAQFNVLDRLRGHNPSDAKVVLFREIQINNEEFLTYCNNTVDLSVRQKAADACCVFWDSSERGWRQEDLRDTRWWVVVTSFWVGVIGYLRLERLLTNDLKAWRPVRAMGIACVEEILSASLAFLNNLPTVLAADASGAVHLYSTFLTVKMGMAVAPVNLSTPLLPKTGGTMEAHRTVASSFPSTTRKLAWAHINWKGHVFFETLGPENSASSTPHLQHRLLRDMWIKSLGYSHLVPESVKEDVDKLQEEVAFARHKACVARYFRNAQIDVPGLLAPPGSTEPTQTIEDSPSGKRKGWKSVITQKIGRWASEYVKQPTCKTHLRQYIKHVPRDCSAAVRDPRLRNRSVSWTRLPTPVQGQQGVRTSAIQTIIGAPPETAMSHRAFHGASPPPEVHRPQARENKSPGILCAQEQPCQAVAVGASTTEADWARYNSRKRLTSVRPS